jgi:glycosyltransferase involved in cell wall biosynthesis
VARAEILVPWYAYPPFRQEGIGGLSVAVYELTRALAEQGRTLTVLVPGGNHEGAEKIDGVNVEHTDEGNRVATGQKLSPEQVSSLAERYSKILSVANFGASSFVKSRKLVGRLWRHTHMVARDREAWTYLSSRPSLEERGRMAIQRRREIKAEALLADTQTICVSRFVMARLVSNGLAAGSKARVIPNGVDTRNFRPKRKIKRFDFLYVGRFQKVKGPDLLFEALKVVGRRVGQVTLGVAGEFEKESRDFLVRILGSSSVSVQFLGKVERIEMPEVINESRFLVMPSRYESFGLPVLEAIACGIPAYVSNVGGLPELVDESVGGLFQSLEPSDMANVMRRAMNDKTVEDRALQYGPIKAKGYDWQLIARRIIEALDSEGSEGLAEPGC